jgi:hypothetical protein
VRDGVGGKAGRLGSGFVRLDADTAEGRDEGFTAFAQLAIGLKHRFNDFGHFGARERGADDLAGNRKDVCVKEAKAALVRAKADARVDRLAGNAREGATVKARDAVKEADAEKRDADYKVAVEKCAAYAGPAKETCVGNAKLQFGKS